MRLLSGAVIPVVMAVLATGCQGAPMAAPGPAPGATQPAGGAPTHRPTTPRTPSPTPTPFDRPGPGSTPPPWLSTRILPEDADGFGVRRPTPTALRTRRFTLPDRLAPLPGTGFAARVVPAPTRVLDRSTWEPGCPVVREELDWVRLTFRGFDDRRHTGELLVNGDVSADLVRVFRTLWRADFPFEEMRVTRASELDLPPTGDGNNTGSFVCRPSTSGSGEFSEHAYGLAIDVNPFQNPYVRGEGADRLVLPELASAYVDRARSAPGMVRADGPVVAAFAQIGWEWGGAWSSSLDYQHFSLTGR